MKKGGFLDFRNTHFSACRPLSTYTKVQLLYGGIIRGKKLQLKKLKDSGKSLLNVGCGPNPAPEYINLDYHWRPQVDLCWDITTGIPLPDDSLRGIYTEHCLEHISFGDCRRTLDQFYRMLRPGGFVRIVVPDAELYLGLYASSRQGAPVKFPFADHGDSEPNFTPMMAVNRVFRNDGHKFAYDFQTLEAMLSGAGFVNVERQSFMNGGMPELLIDTQSRQIESLYVEAQKPAG